jgi:hypothetical protein
MAYELDFLKELMPGVDTELWRDERLPGGKQDLNG